MTTLNLIVTDAGRAEIVNATNTGTLPVVISEIALGTGRWTPDASALALDTELKRVNTIGGIAVADDTLHLTIADYSSDTYSLGEFGLYTDSGVLFAIYSDALNGITDKAADAALLIATDTVFTTIAPGSITVNGAGFTNPPASETVPGVMEIASQAEVDTGTDHSRAVTPKTLVSTKIPAGTRMLFVQAAAPAGWVQDNTYNDRMIRVVDDTGAGGAVAGNWALSGVTVDGHALDLNQIPAHNHGGGNHRHTITWGDGDIGSVANTLWYGSQANNWSQGTRVWTSDYSGTIISTQGGGQAHSHGLTSDGNWRPAYVDVIACIKQ